METSVRLFRADSWTDMQPHQSVQGPVWSLQSSRPGLHILPDIQLDSVRVVSALVKQWGTTNTITHAFEVMNMWHPSLFCFFDKAQLFVLWWISSWLAKRELFSPHSCVGTSWCECVRLWELFDCAAQSLSLGASGGPAAERPLQRSHLSRAKDQGWSTGVWQASKCTIYM